MFIKEFCGDVGWNEFLDALCIHTKLHMQLVAFFNIKINPIEVAFFLISQTT